MAEIKVTTKDVEDKVKFKGKLVWDRYDGNQVEEAFGFAEEYKQFLNKAKTEREAVAEVMQSAQKAGFHAVSDKGKDKRIYRLNKDKNIVLATLGKRPLKEGIRIVVSHIDSPRIDLKQNPFYEELDMVMLRTHYYGGLKKYQWVAQPLALHGVIIKESGEKVSVQIGEAADDPVFTICDLLPHLSRKVQEEKKLKDAIEAEKLTILAGHLPYPDQEAKERVKLRILELLHQRYGLIEEDFLSAELELVPAGKARDVGFDRAFVASYGHDDRVCAYTSLKAMEEVATPHNTTVALFLDKEETGSEGNTGAKSRFLEHFVADILRAAGTEPTDILIRDILLASKALCADVTAGIDPNYKDVHESQNNAKMGYGVCLSKFTGAGGKYSTSDANAEYVAEIRELFNRKGIVWQMGELGKVDEGGGGTVAKYLAVYGMDVIDCGTPLLSMHSPFEVASKGDIYETFRAYRVFFEGE